MAGAIVVVVLAGLVLPISMLIAAFIIDVLTVIWVVTVVGHDHWTRLQHVGATMLSHLHVLPARHARAH